MSFNTKLTDLLKTDPRFVDDEGELVIAAVQDRAWQVDRDLVKLLLSDAEIKDKFFEEIGGHWIFNTNTFLDYVSQKNFLDNSYTRFRNRIGLTIGDKYLRERGDVALVWPYKDTVLEGGQTREEEKRKEIFFNEVLAQDEINRLLDPKVLTNFVRYTAKGKEKVTRFKRDESGVIRENLILKGNNLLALHTLKNQFRGQVKLIYIDPPYNTSIDSFGYNDNFNHSAWLTFMKNRLEIAKKILAEDGTIFVQLDWHESHYGKILLDEVFGREHLINELIWCYTGPGSPLMKQFNRKHDVIFWYRKGDNWTFNGDDVRVPLAGGLGGGWAGLDKSLRKEYAEKGKIPEDWTEVFKDKKEFLEEFSKLYDIYEQVQDNDWLKIAVAARLRKDGQNRTGYLTEKPLKLMERIIKVASNEGDVILDFFSGAGTTGFVANYLKRQFVMIEQLEDTQKVLQKRFKNTNYIYFELMQYNEAFMERIQTAKSSKELLKVWREMAEGSFLNWYVNPQMPEEAVKDFEELGKGENGLEKQKRLLAELLDKNQLYVNLSEIDDAQFQVSKEDKALNKAFYGEAYNA